jgi:hypothetical protein
MDLSGVAVNLSNDIADLTNAEKDISGAALEILSAAVDISGALVTTSDIIRALPHLKCTDANALRAAVLEKFPHLDENAKDFVEHHLSALYEILVEKVEHSAKEVAAGAAEAAQVVSRKFGCRCW